MASSAVVENSTNHSDVVHHARPRFVTCIFSMSSNSLIQCLHVHTTYHIHVFDTCMQVKTCLILEICSQNMYSHGYFCPVDQQSPRSFYTSKITTSALSHVTAIHHIVSLHKWCARKRHNIRDYL